MFLSFQRRETIPFQIIIYNHIKIIVTSETRKKEAVSDKQNTTMYILSSMYPKVR